MKLFVLSALLMLTAFAARASEGQSFVLAMDYSTYLRIAQNDMFGEARKALTENPFEEKESPDAEEVSSEDDAKWNPVKTFKKPKKLSGGGFIDTNDSVAVGAFAGYQYDGIDENKFDEEYSVKINLNIAL